jgi:hypothetical protein
LLDVQLAKVLQPYQCLMVCHNLGYNKCVRRKVFFFYFFCAKRHTGGTRKKEIKKHLSTKVTC